MPAYNFKAQFVEPIQSGKKVTTIRPCRKRPTRVGDTLHLFTGQRKKACRKIGVYRCKSVAPVVILPVDVKIRLRDISLSWEQMKTLANLDGFADIYSFCTFFYQTYGVGPIEMELITWERFS